MGKAIKVILVVIIAFILVMLVMSKCGKGKVSQVTPQETVSAGAEKTAAGVTVTAKEGKPLPVKTAVETKPKIGKVNTAEKVNMKDYEFKLSSDKSTFEVLKKGQVILSKQAGEKESFQMTSDSKEKSLPKAGTDMTGDGRPDVVLKTKSEKDSCSNIYSVFAVGDDMALIAEIKGLADGIEFKDLDKDGIMEIIGKDCTFLDWWAALGTPPAPKLVLRYLEGSGYVLADELMRKDPPVVEDMQAYADSCKGKPISKVWSYMLDLIYTGAGDDAWKFYDMVEWDSDWESETAADTEAGGKDNKTEYLEAFKEHLSTSPYWQSLKKLNNWEFADMGM